MGQDGRQSLQGLDLLTHDLSDLRGLSCGLARQFDRGALQFGAGLLEFATDLGRHLLHVPRGASEALHRLGEELLHVAHRAGIGLLEGSDRLLAFPTRGGSELVEVVADRTGGVLRGFGQEGPKLAGAAIGVLQGLVDQGREVFHRGFEFASSAADARRETVERLTPPFDLPVDVVMRDPEVPGGFGEPTVMLFQGVGDRVGIAERRSGRLMHRIDLLADFVDHSAEIRHATAERLLGRMEVRACRFDQADQGLARDFQAADEARQPVQQLATGARQFREGTSGSGIERFAKTLARLIERRRDLRLLAVDVGHEPMAALVDELGEGFAGMSEFLRDLAAASRQEIDQQGAFMLEEARATRPIAFAGSRRGCGRGRRARPPCRASVRRPIPRLPRSGA